MNLKKIRRNFFKSFLATLIYSFIPFIYFTPVLKANNNIIFTKEKSFDKDYCSFSFEHPVYSSIEQDTLFFDEQPDHPCWFDVFIPAFDCRLHCSYTPIGDEDKTFEALKKDAFDLVDWHNKRANYIDELLIDKGNNVTGIAFSIEGPAASPLQFFLTDTENHFFRGALYFNTRVRPDSLAPIYEFVKEDVFKLIETFEWEEGV